MADEGNASLTLKQIRAELDSPRSGAYSFAQLTGHLRSWLINESGPAADSQLDANVARQTLRCLQDIISSTHRESESVMGWFKVAEDIVRRVEDLFRRNEVHSPDNVMADLMFGRAARWVLEGAGVATFEPYLGREKPIDPYPALLIMATDMPRMLDMIGSSPQTYYRQFVARRPKLLQWEDVAISHRDLRHSLDTLVESSPQLTSSHG